jgi:hypothetical protein
VPLQHGGGLAQRELVLLHNSTEVTPTGTRPWLEAFSVHRHHHLVGAVQVVNAVDPWFESARFQPLHLKCDLLESASSQPLHLECDILVSSLCFQM